jgi:hypothetical protein
MDAVFRSFGDPPVPPLPPPPASPLDETINVRNELREMAAKVTGKKKQATVSQSISLIKSELSYSSIAEFVQINDELLGTVKLC